MKRQISIVSFTGLAALLIAGCGQSHSAGQNAPALNNDVSSAVKAVRATITVTPGGVSTCDKNAHVDPEVTWQRIDPAVKNTKVTVSAPGSSEEKLFATGGFGGSAKAGDWVVPGVTFHLYNADTGGALASYTETALPCTN